jgi:exopolyphosphatase / guanosine-5'-triphosphate,3'-diphosphate pyrophosphatase
MELIAAIDIGTNTVRLLIAKETGSGIAPVVTKRVVTRLGGGFTRERGISPEAWDRTMAALISFSQEMSAYPVRCIRAAATSAVRDAANGGDFCRAVAERVGIAIEVIDGTEEGMLTLRGVLSGVYPRSGDFMVVDIGGGSTEYIVTRGESPVFTRSLGLGVIRLTEGRGEPSRMEEKIRSELSTLKGEAESLQALPAPDTTTLVATAGTATTLAAIDLQLIEYDYRKVNNHVLSIATVETILSRLLPLSSSERLAVPGLEEGREDLIIAGTLVLLDSMKTFGFSEVKVSDFGLLEGLALSIATADESGGNQA